jgi:hypothetical protein
VRQGSVLVRQTLRLVADLLPLCRDDVLRFPRLAGAKRGPPRSGEDLSMGPQVWRINTARTIASPAPAEATTLTVIRWPQPPGAKRLWPLAQRPSPIAAQQLNYSRIIAGTTDGCLCGRDHWSVLLKTFQWSFQNDASAQSRSHLLGPIARGR